MPDGTLLRQEVVKFSSGAWFGDYQLLLNISSVWDLEASAAPKNSTVGHTIPPGKIQVFEVEHEKFLQICNRFPTYRRWLLGRANIRRCHFMKVFEENRHIYLL